MAHALTYSTLVAEALAAARAGTLRLPPSELGVFTLADGYLFAAELDRQLREGGWRRVGRKLGFTNRASWPTLGLNRPLWGFVYDMTAQTAPDGATSLAITRSLAPRIETEVVLGLRTAPAPDDPDADLLHCVEWAALGLEVIDCHYPQWRHTAADSLADFLFHAALVIGPRRLFQSPAEIDAWARCLPDGTVTLRKGLHIVAEGGPAQTLGSPLASLAALVEMLRAQDAAPLAASEIVATGTMTPPIAIADGDIFEATTEGLGLLPIRVRITGSSAGDVAVED